MFRPFKHFAKIYIDDIIIFSKIINEHVFHFKQFFLFRQRRVNLSLTRIFVYYPSVRILKQRIDALNMTTFENEIEAISAIKFSENLRDFEIFLKMTNWLKSFIPRYVQLTDSLQKRKTLFTKSLGATNKFGRKRQAIKTLYYEPLPEKLKTFSEFKQTFAQPTFRIICRF